jgi:hypothetical protein
MSIYSPYMPSCLILFTNQYTEGLFVKGDSSNSNKIFTLCAKSHHLTKYCDMWQKRVFVPEVYSKVNAHI